jgi:hydroxymethylpyrimidine/phosphomethylpyrimidine kinase
MIDKISNKSLVLCVGGFDPSGAAGILQDHHAINRAGGMAHSITTCLTAQNDIEFLSMTWCEEEAIKQLEGLIKRFDYAVVKFGLIPSPQFANEVLLKVTEAQSQKPKVIWDPVLKASAGYEIHDPKMKSAWNDFLKSVDLYTPNWLEAKVFFGEEVYEELLSVNQDTAVLLKGGHREEFLNQNKAEDELWVKGLCQRFSLPKSPYDKRGTGCALASGIAAGVAQDKSWAEALKVSKQNLLNYFNSDSNKIGNWYV